jgi:hypothetical protein
MFILDSLLVFVLDKIATVVDNELNDDTALREQLLAAQMQLDVGEISQKDFDELEADIFARLRDIRDRQGAPSGATSSADYKVTGVEASFEGDEH